MYVYVAYHELHVRVQVCMCVERVGWVNIYA